MKKTLCLIISIFLATQAFADNKELLKSINENLIWVKKEIGKKEKSLNSPANSHESKDIYKELKALKLKKKNLEKQFIETATDLPAPIFEEQNNDKKRDLIKEVQELLTPVLDGLRRLSEKPRRIEKLRYEIEELSVQKDQIIKVLKKLEGQQKEKEFNEFKKSIKNGITLLKEKERHVVYELTSRESTLKKLLGEKRTFIQASKELLGTFFKTKGKNLFFALTALIFIFWLLMSIRKKIFRMNIFKTRLQPAQKAIHALYNTASITLSVLSAILCLYILNDWILFTILIIAIMATIWSAKQFIPQFLQEARLILNLGTVKEHERVFWNGIPWEVKRLNFFSTLINPELEGGQMKVSSKELLNLHSRKVSEKERWFPTSKNDWILLGDELHQVICQSPDHVELKKHGGENVSIQTSEYLAMSFQNLSHGFRVQMVGGLDYGIQDHLIEKIIPTFKSKLYLKLKEQNELAQFVKNISCEYNDSGASSLNLWLSFDCDGSLAPKRDYLQRLIQQYFVEICNEESLEIPFNQLTLSTRESSNLSLTN